MTALISEQDLEDAIESVDFYLEQKGSEFVEVKRNRFLMLLSWLRLKQSQLPSAP
jgi:hypothetical protein